MGGICRVRGRLTGKHHQMSC